jgi:hypothetical protein
MNMATRSFDKKYVVSERTPEFIDRLLSPPSKLCALSDMEMSRLLEIGRDEIGSLLTKIG